MSLSLDVVIRIKLNRNDVLTFLNKLFSDYRGYFSNLDDMGISTAEAYGFPNDIDISDRNFTKIEISRIPQTYRIWIFMKNQGYLNIKDNGKTCVLIFGIANQGYFNKELNREFLLFIGRILQLVECDYLVMGREMVYAPDFDYYGPLRMMGANKVDAIHHGLIKLLKNTINSDYTIKDIKAKLRKASIKIEKISGNFYLLNAIKFSTKLMPTAKINVKRKVVVAESKLEELLKEK